MYVSFDFPGHFVMEGTAAGWSTLVLGGMNHLRSQSVFTDVALLASDGTVIPAHSLVLASGSGHFKDVSTFKNRHKRLWTE